MNETRETDITDAMADVIAQALVELIAAYQEDGERLEAISFRITGDRSAIDEMMADLAKKPDQEGGDQNG